MAGAPRTAWMAVARAKKVWEQRRSGRPEVCSSVQGKGLWRLGRVSPAQMEMGILLF